MTQKSIYFLPAAECLWNHPNLLPVQGSAADCSLVTVTPNALTQRFPLDCPEGLPFENVQIHRHWETVNTITRKNWSTQKWQSFKSTTHKEIPCLLFYNQSNPTLLFKSKFA